MVKADAAPAFVTVPSGTPRKGKHGKEHSSQSCRDKSSSPLHLADEKLNCMDIKCLSSPFTEPLSRKNKVLL